MWIPDSTKLVKVLLHDQGEDKETPWAEDLGPLENEPTTRRVRLGNVPFLHAKPTYEDVILVQPNEDGMLAWDSLGVAFEEMGTRIDVDSGRWAMIVDYELLPGTDDINAAFRAFDAAGENADIAVEGAFTARSKRGGRAYLAIPGTMTLADALSWLDSVRLPLRFRLFHPVDDE